MIIPNAEQIEAANDWMLRLPHLTLIRQVGELHEAIGDNVDVDLNYGFNLGLQTARMVISQNVAIAKAGIRPEDVL